MSATTTTEPTFSIVPPGDEASAQDALDLADAYGILLDEWQRDIVRGIHREVDGYHAASQAGCVVSRQSGKGNCILVRELSGLLLFKENILHTAHAVRTSSDAFRRLWELFESHDDLSRLVKRRSSQIGLEYVELTNGARAAFTTRSASSGRGLSIDLLVVDEAEDFPAHEVGALKPTTFARPNSQSLYFGTAPGPMHDSEAFENLRKTAHDGLNPRLAWWEWSADYGEDIDDEDVWRRTNPAVATGRIPLQAIRDDRAVLPPDQFRSERLSMWVPSGGAREQVFTEEMWMELVDPHSTPLTELSIGIDTPPSRDFTTVALAGRREDGLLHVEHYTTEQGMAWVTEWVKERLTKSVRAVVLDDKSPLTELDWGAAGVRTLLADYRGVAAAAGQFSDGITDGKLHHRGQTELGRGVLGAERRPMAGGAAFGWQRRASGSSVLIAASLALWGVDAPVMYRPQRRRPGEPSTRRAVILA